MFLTDESGKERQMAKKTDLIGYCGIYCATCPAYTQNVATLAGDLGKELRQNKFGKYADYLAKMPGLKAFENYEKGSELLKVMAKMRCKGCKTGGGSADCKIRICAKQDKFAGCWQCSELKTCGKFEELRQSGDKTYLKNLRMIQKSGLAGFVKKACKKA